MYFFVLHTGIPRKIKVVEKKIQEQKKISETKKNLASLSFSIWALNDSIRLRFDVDFWHEFFICLKHTLSWDHSNEIMEKVLDLISFAMIHFVLHKRWTQCQKSCKKFRSVNKSIVLNCQVRSTRTSRYHQSKSMPIFNMLNIKRSLSNIFRWIM